MTNKRLQVFLVTGCSVIVNVTVIANVTDSLLLLLLLLILWSLSLLLLFFYIVIVIVLVVVIVVCLGSWPALVLQIRYRYLLANGSLGAAGRVRGRRALLCAY